MAIRQYIGARYVPRFLGTYSATTIYDALDVVDDGMGTSYIARKTVPAGTPLTNTDYWFIYGASSGAILDLQNRMTTAESDIDDLTERADRRYVLIADSYGEGTGATPSDGWTAAFKAYMKLDNDHCYIAQLSGSGFVGNVSDTFEDLLDNVYSSVSNPDTITDVIVCGGWNDIGKATVAQAVFDFCSKSKLLFPNALITIGMIAYDSQASGTQRSGITKTIEDYYAGANNKFRTLGGIEYCLRRSSILMAADGIHPSATGYLVLIKSLLSGINGGSPYGYYPFQNHTVSYTDANNHTGTVIQRIDHDQAILSFPDSLGQFQLGATKPSPGAWVKLCDFTTNNILHGAVTATNQLDNNCVDTTAIIYSPDFPGVHYASVECMVGIYENGLYIKITGVDPATGSFYDCTNATNVSLKGNLTFNTLRT